MKPTKLLALVVPILLGIAAACWTSIQFWYDMKEGLIAFLGFLAASLVQVMPITANFLQSDRLSPIDAKRLTDSLTKQQKYWMGLLSATILAMVIVIVGSSIKASIDSWPPLFHFQLLPAVGWAALACFAIASSVSFVLVKMLGLFEGMWALHRLRVELVLLSAKREAAEQISTDQKEAEIVPPGLPAGYGQIVRPH